jgi:predicted DNA-binding transcriptional regulator YafY
MKNHADLGYFAPIEYDKARRAYYYTDRDYSIDNFALQADEIDALKFYASCLKIYSDYGIFKDFSNAIQKIVEGINIRHSLNRNVNPGLIVQTDTELHFSGADYLTQIVHAINDRHNIEFLYRKYGEECEATLRMLSPYLLKEYKNRWYVLGVLQNETEIKTFGLDRIVSLKTVPQTAFSEIDFDHSKYFKHSFGITRPNEPVEKIILEFASKEGPYIKSLPIHPSQQIVLEAGDILQISIEVIPSYELYEFILGKTPHVKVVSPQHIADYIAANLKEGLKEYGK